MKRKCELCGFWKSEDCDQETGECRRYVPVVSPGQSEISWPVTQNNEWCGDFRSDQHLEQEVPQRCKFCEFWETGGFDHENGECRRAAPSTSHEQNQQVWLTMQSEDWCGEFRVRSGKLVGTTKCPV